MASERAECGPRALSPACLTVRTLKLADFRNYGSLNLQTEPGLTVITGANGAGKTNLLEALSLLAPGRGLRRAPQHVLPREGSPGAWAVHALLDTPEGEISIGTGQTVQPGDGSGSGRRVKINGTKAAVTDLSNKVAMLWLTPAMDGLFSGPASDRRRFLDRLTDAFEAGHSRRVSDHEKLLRSRNRLLSEPPFDDLWMGVLETQIAELAIAIACSRAGLVSALREAISEARLAANLFPAADLALIGTLENQVGERPPGEIEDDYRQKLKEERWRDQAAGRTLAGIHLSDLDVKIMATQTPAALGSTGQQKGLLISILMAEAELTRRVRGAPPIMLLDEVAAHLDTLRRTALFDHLRALEVQAWMTGTDKSAFSALGPETDWLTVTDSCVSKEN